MGAGGRGAQTVFPPSVHVSGEPIAWESGGFGEIAEVSGEELLKHTRRLAAATELARNCPQKAARNTDGAHILGGFPGAAAFRRLRQPCSLRRSPWPRTSRATSGAI